MKCLVLAAGLGSRLRGISDSKPLTLIGGKPLIGHVIERAAQGGASGFVVATGYRAEQVEDYLAGLAERSGLPVRCVRVPDWTLANGHSVLAGADTIEGDYLLSMSDHLFDPAIVQRLIAGRPQEAALTLAVDSNLAGPLLDIDDATKVERAADGRIVRIGKQLERYDAIDTGLFHATPALAGAIREAIAGGAGGSLSDGVQRLADAGRAGTVDVGEVQWIDVDSPEMLRRAEELVAQG